ncbi:MAG: type IV toxin-antitoxin system AbiEi family antitoxin domain-containing protein [Anaerolineales bacterium]|nr:type IV toxin-antitoxin system AbiEi family antitoxin domain-containing protein [Anaerolineales bacterium]
MEFNLLLKLVGDDPVFESSLLLAGNVDPGAVRLQLSRWVKSGRIYQLRRGLYCIAPPYQKVQPHPFLVANRLQRASYVSLQSALAYYDLIPETVYITTSVSTGRPEQLETPSGTFLFRHIKTDLLFGYQMVDLGGQNALVASPEKALLDLIYLHPGADSAAYLEELRLQNTGRLDTGLLKEFSENFSTPKLRRAYREISRTLTGETGGFEDL